MKEHWIVGVDRYGYKECVRVYEGRSIRKAHLCIGQMMLSEEVDQITVYRNGEMHRCYERKRVRMNERNVRGQ